MHLAVCLHPLEQTQVAEFGVDRHVQPRPEPAAVTEARADARIAGIQRVDQVRDGLTVDVDDRLTVSKAS